MGHRFEIWRDNRKLIEEHNENTSQGMFNFTLKMNQFGDYVILLSKIQKGTLN